MLTHHNITQPKPEPGFGDLTIVADHYDELDYPQNNVSEFTVWMSDETWDKIDRPEHISIEVNNGPDTIEYALKVYKTDSVEHFHNFGEMEVVNDFGDTLFHMQLAEEALFPEFEEPEESEVDIDLSGAYNEALQNAMASLQALRQAGDVVPVSGDLISDSFIPAEEVPVDPSPPVESEPPE